MARYAVSFDLNRSGMTAAGYTESRITTVYQSDIPRLLARHGFSRHLEGSVYLTEKDRNGEALALALQQDLIANPPAWGTFVRRAHCYRVEEPFFDITPCFTGRPAEPMVT
jgi:virulence-associated protein VapD